MYPYAPGQEESFVIRNLVLHEVTPDRFSITDLEHKTGLKVVVEKVEADRASPDIPAGGRYYAFRNPSDESCIDGARSNKCAWFRKSKATQIASLLRDGKLVDVTNAVRRNIGLFRIRPQRGFREGRTYVIGYTPKESAGAGAGFTVNIGPPLRGGPEDRFGIEPQGAPYPLPGPSTDCDRDFGGMGQPVIYTLPSAYEPYRQSLVFFTEKMDGAFRPYVYSRSMCTTIPFGGSTSGPGKELIAGSLNGAGKPASTQVRGYVGFLELNDELHATPVVTIDFERGKHGSFNAYALLKDAIAGKNAEAIRRQVCALSEAGAPEAAPGEFLPRFAELSRSPDAATQRCAGWALVAMGGRLKVLDATTAKAMVGVMSARLSDTGQQEKASALIRLEWFARDIGQRAASGGAGPGVNLSILQPLLPTLAKTLADPSPATLHEQERAATVLTMMGPIAEPVLPDLLKAVNINNYGLVPNVLLAIAPGDPRVLEALRQSAASGSVWSSNASLAYARAVQDRDKPAAVAALVKAAEAGHPEAITALGEMGSDARAAAPMLLRVARTSQASYLRSAAMEALATIGGDDRPILDVVVHNLTYRPKKPKEPWEDMSDLRGDAVQALGRMGIRAQPALPSLLKVFDAQLAEDEFPILMDALRRIKAPREAVLQALRHAAQHSPSPVIREKAADALRETEAQIKKDREAAAKWQAGDRHYGYRHGDALHGPNGVAVDAAGNVFVADRSCHCVRKISTGTGASRMVAGTGMPGYSPDRSLAGRGELDAPTRLAFDSKGNLYIADGGNDVVLRVDAKGVITTVAGSGTAGEGWGSPAPEGPDYGPATQARLGGALGIAVAPNDDLYIADTNHDRVVKVDAKGMITLVAGNRRAGSGGDGGPAINASLNSPRGVAVDAQGNVYIADSANGRIRKVNPGGIITTVAGTGNPVSVAVDAGGDIYYVDGDHVRRLDRQGTLTVVAGAEPPRARPRTPGGSGRGLSYSEDVAVDAKGNLYIADTGNWRIVRVNRAGDFSIIDGDGK